MYTKEFLNSPEIVALRYHTAQPFMEREAAAQERDALRGELARESRQPGNRNTDDPPTRCRVLIPIRARVRGETVDTEVGDVIEMPRSEALGNQAIGRVEVLT